MSSPSRAMLHTLIESLPDEALDRAMRALAELDPDAPIPPDDEAGIRRGIEDAAAGRVVSRDEASARVDAVLAARRGNAA